MPKYNGGSAFPGVDRTYLNNGGYEDDPHSGMTLRQWYAGMAMQGMLAEGDATHISRIPEAAFEIADAMIAHEQSEAEAWLTKEEPKLPE